MTEPSEAAIEEADRLACDCGNDALSAYRRALALHLDEVDRVARIACQHMIDAGLQPSTRTELVRLMLPDPVDPLEEALGPSGSDQPPPAAPQT